MPHLHISLYSFPHLTKPKGQNLLEEVEDWIATPLTLVATGTPLEKYTGYIVEPALAFNLLAELAAPPAVAEPA